MTKKWCGMLSHLKGGWLPEFREEFFSWFDQQIVVIYNYEYARIDFWEDPDMVLTEGEDWNNDLGKFLFFLEYLNFFVVF